jgi:hypothetical protein
MDLHGGVKSVMNGAKEIVVLITKLAASATWTLACAINIIVIAQAEEWILLLFWFKFYVFRLFTERNLGCYSAWFSAKYGFLASCRVRLPI